MNTIKRIIRKAGSVPKRLARVFRFMVHVYRYGGYTAANIACIHHGSILKGKRVLVTGGGSGIGKSIAKKCLQEGAYVVITGRSEPRLKDTKEELGHNDFLKTLVWDVSLIGDMDDKIRETETLLGGPIDILVNNAGIVNGTPFPNVTEAIWDAAYSTNSKGLFFLTQTLCSKWIKEKKQSTKKIINISSQGGFIGATYPYRMSKWDIVGLTQGMGLAMIKHGIIINGIAPGITATAALPTVIKQEENIYTERIPAGRYALPEEMAELAVFLMSDATNFIVGQTIVCDGGYTIK